MKFFSSWAEQIIIAVVLSSIIEMILPENKNKKYIKMVMGIYILFNIISPIINNKDLLSLNDINLENYSNSDINVQNNSLNQSSMDERLQELYIEELENNIKEKVEEYGYEVHYCKVDASITGNKQDKGINKISISVSKNEEIGLEKDNKSDIKNIDKIEIKVGLNRFFEEESDDKNYNDDVNELKDELSNYYELDSNKIHIKLV